MTEMDQPKSGSSLLSGRLSRRRLFPLAGAAVAVAALAPASLANAQDMSSLANLELLGSQTGSLTGNRGGSFATYQMSNPSGTATTLTLSYRPVDAPWGSAIGFNVYQNGAQIASALASGVSKVASATVTPSASGGVVLVQCFNYSPETISFTLTSSLPAVAVPRTSATARYVYVGTDGDGIHVYKFNPTNAALSLVQVVPTEVATFVAIDPQMKFLYCNNTLGMVSGKAGGRVSSFAIDPSTGALTFINTQPTNALYPAHISVHPSGRYLLASNYGDGSFPVYPILADGRLAPMSDDFKETGTGPNLGRQEGPHAHQIVTDPQGKFSFGVDLGDDKVFVWQLDAAAGKLVPNPIVPYVQVASGTGPRHIAFTPNGKFAYVLGEMSSSITAFGYNGEKGLLSWLQTVSTVPSDFSGLKWSAEIVVHPNGKFVYASNRTHDSIAIFNIDSNTGILSLIGWESTQGKTPRNISLDPSASFLLASNEQGDNIVSFAVDQSTGKLTATGQVTQCPAPVCVVFGRPIPS